MWSLRSVALFIILAGCASAPHGDPGGPLPPAPVPAPVPAAAPLAPVTPDPAAAGIAAAVEAAHAAGVFDGLVVVLRDDRVIYRGAVGLADRERGTPHAVGEVVRFASIAKQITAALVMQQVEAGRVSLDEKLAVYLPAAPSALRAITIRDLLRHTSGLQNPDDGTPDGQMPAFYQRTDADVGVHGAVFSTVCGQPPKRAPGSFEYNNCDYLVLGAMLEAVTHQRFDALVDQAITKGLGLPSLRIVTPAHPDTSAVVGYLEDGKREATYNLATFGASAALVGTIDDLARWGRTLVTHRLVSDATTATMFRGDPAMQQEALGSWAYKLAVPGRSVALVERQGSIGGMRSLLLLAPEQAIVIAIVANTEKAQLFELWAKRGLPYDLVVAATAAP